MTGWNLPPGCTDADIDRAFGCSEGRRGTYTVTVVRTVSHSVEIEVEASNVDDAQHDALVMARTGSLIWAPTDDDCEYVVVDTVEPPEPDPDDERDARADFEYDRDR